jgi:hypothetical protein
LTYDRKGTRKKIADTNAMLLPKPKAEKDRDCLSVYQSAFFFLFFYVDMMMTHTVRTGDLGACVIGKNARWIFLSCMFVKLPPASTIKERTNERTSERSIHKGISFFGWH